MFHAPLGGGGGGNGQTQEARMMDPINSRGVTYVKILNFCVTYCGFATPTRHT